MSFRLGIISVFILLVSIQVFGQFKSYTTQKIIGKAPIIDGNDNEEAWKSVEWGGDFIQNDPNDGAKPSQQTRYKITYDNNNLYIFIQALDSVPREIEKRLSRRDYDDGDWMAISIDSYDDNLTAFTFGVTSAGVQFDFMYVNDNTTDPNWDAVYYSSTEINSEGWNAEMRIPLSQLRFAKKNQHTWGINVFRYLYRKQEISFWQPIPRTAPGMVSLYGELNGLNNIQPRRSIELLPYTYTKAIYSKKIYGNPFEKGSNYKGTAGMDGKISITNDITLNFTINPDFGQVEADPAVVNLTAFETFFTEKRPFFVEGRNIFSFKLTGADSENNQNMLFYSRRIGRTPHYTIPTDSGEYVSAPEQSTILGSFKLSGKTKKGFSIGIIESATKNEFAKVDSVGFKRKMSVEPFTNYFIARASQDFGKGNSSVGGIITATNRFFSESYLDFLPKASYTGGIDGIHYWKNKTYYVSAKAVFSRVEGSKTAINYLQRASTRYFQRPDNTHVNYDPEKTTLEGLGGTLETGKAGRGNWQYLAYITFRTPGLDFNDVGFLKQSDDIQQLFWLRYRKFQPFGKFRWALVNFTQYYTIDFGGNSINKGFDINTYSQFTNYFNLGAGFNYSGNTLSRGELWGGPALQLPAVKYGWGFIETDSRKKLIAKLNLSVQKGNFAYFGLGKVNLELTYKPMNTLSISLIPQYSKGYNDLQYTLTTLNQSNKEKRYIMATLSREVIDLSLRVNVSLSPNFSVQYYAQPYIFSGKYSNFKRITDPKATNYYDRFSSFDKNNIFYNSDNDFYVIDEDNNSIADYGFYNPNFHYLQFRSNMVLRWEYRRGSSLYLVWSQGGSDWGYEGNMQLERYADEMLHMDYKNVFMLKISYLYVF